MHSGMYSALSGSLSAQKRLEVLASNLANANTVGFKGDQIQFESVLAQVNGPSTSQTPAFSGETFSTDFSQGGLQSTGNVLDLALEGDGFFTVQTPQGVAYTRAGNFHRGEGGKLLSADGYQVLGTGNLNLSGSHLEISGKGQVTVDGAVVGTLAIVDFPKPYQLTKLGGGLFVPANPQVTPTAAGAEVKQGYLESSNVKVIVEMARMIEASRYFESCAKAVKSYDELAAKAANDLGRV